MTTAQAAEKKIRGDLADGKIETRAENAGGARYSSADDRMGTKGTLMAQHMGVNLPPPKTKKNVDTKDADLEKAIAQANRQGGTDNLGPYIVTPVIPASREPILGVEIPRPKVFDVKINSHDDTYMVYSPTVYDGYTTDYLDTDVGQWCKTGVSVSKDLYVVGKRGSIVDSRFATEDPQEDDSWAIQVASVVPGSGLKSFIQGVLVLGGTGEGPAGPTWGYGPVEWDSDCKAFVQYLGTFSMSGCFSCATKMENGKKVPVEKKVVIEVISHVCDHTAGVV